MAVRLALAFVGFVWLAAAHAQSASGDAPAQPPPQRPANPDAERSGASPGAARPAPPQKLDRVEVSSDRNTETRRNSTASRIVIGREEIERFGDSSITETLRRLPGVTTGGRPGRGGDPRMRGMGSGYTQILINGEPMPRGFSLDSLPPEQVERIEIMRAPTAEHGARAVAGTINIVLRDPLDKRANDVRAGVSAERGLVRPGVSWTRNDAFAGGAYTFTLSGQHHERYDDIDTRTLAEDLATAAPVLDQHETGLIHAKRDSVHANGRIQWRLGGGHALVLQPLLVANRARDRITRDLAQALGPTPPPFAHAESRGESDFRLARLNVTGQHRLSADTRLELRGYGARSRYSDAYVRFEWDEAGVPVRRIDGSARHDDTSASLGGKVTHRTTREHSLVGGWEAEVLSRDQTRTTIENGVPTLVEFGEALAAKSRRLAAYAQDEWNPSPRWSAYAGLRWERIDTRSDDASMQARNRSDVWTPLAHAVWRPDPDARDQVRLSLTRSYRSPTLSELIGRPYVNPRFPAPGANVATSADRAGNPDLKPELARGIDLAYEKYLSQGGVLSANFFYRRINDLIRTVTMLEDVLWSPVPRWVSRPRNVGDATTRGIELEAKFRAEELVAGAPPLYVNANLAFFDSHVEGVPGPNNYIDQQPRATANLGAEYRLRSAPVRIGANVNWTPGRTVQRTDIQAQTTDRKVVADAFVLWLVDANTRVRLSAGNLAPRDFTTTSTIFADDQRQTAINGGPTYTTVSLRLEMKL